MAKRNIIKSLKDLSNDEKWFNQAIRDACFCSGATQITPTFDTEDTVVDMCNETTVKSEWPSQIATILKPKESE